MNVFIVNGYPQSGKTTFETLCQEELFKKNIKVKMLSTIDPIKEIARTIGWDGNKDAKGRKFLSDLKDALEDYCNFSFNYIRDILAKAEYDVYFIDSREPKQIAELCHTFNAYAILVRRYDKNVDFLNHADLDAEKFEYNIYIDNTSSFENLKRQVEYFINMNIRKE